MTAEHTYTHRLRHLDGMEIFCKLLDEEIESSKTQRMNGRICSSILHTKSTHSHSKSLNNCYTVPYQTREKFTSRFHSFFYYFMKVFETVMLILFKVFFTLLKFFNYNIIHSYSKISRYF